MNTATFDWQQFFHYIWPPTAFQESIIWKGLIATIVIAIISQLLGTILGFAAALAKMSRLRLIRGISAAYITYFRGTPLIVQLALVYFGVTALGIYRFPTITLLGMDVPGWMQASIITLSLNEGAYMAEIVRAGIRSIDRGQTEAAKAIGMTSRKTFLHVILPQAAVVILPPFGNEFNGMIKNTSLCVVIGGAELFNAFEQINARTFLPFELFLAVSLYYLALTIAWSFVQNAIERRLGRSHRAHTSPNGGLHRVFQRVRHNPRIQAPVTAAP